MRARPRALGAVCEVDEPPIELLLLGGPQGIHAVSLEDPSAARRCVERVPFPRPGPKVLVAVVDEVDLLCIEVDALGVTADELVGAERGHCFVEEVHFRFVVACVAGRRAALRLTGLRRCRGFRRVSGLYALSVLLV